ncbi:unnamed protein product, partial [Closterium sp. NIES-54]
PSAPTASAATATTATGAIATAAPAYCATMDSLRVLAFDHEGRPVQFDRWLDDLPLYLLSNIKDAVSLTAQALYDAVVARYSSPATAALGRLLLPYLFPELSAFATVKDLLPMFITLYFIVTHLPHSLRSVRDHFLSLDPTYLTVDLLEQHLLAAETSAVAVGAARGTPRPPFFEGCSPSPLAPSYASAAAADVTIAEDVRAASASAKRRSSKGKGGKGGGGGSGGGGGGSGSSGGGSSEGGGGGGTGGGSGGSGGGGGGSNGSGGSGTSGGGTGARRVGSGGGQRHCPYVIHTGGRAGQTCGQLHTQHRCFSRLDDVWRAEFGDNVELPRWANLLRSRISIFDLDFDAILSSMYALSVSAKGDYYRCVSPDPGIAAAALGASESGTLPGTGPAQALHTFTLDSGASACFFRDSTTLTLLSTPVPVRLADPSGGPVVAHSSIVLPCLAVPSGSLSGLHLPSFSTNLVSTAALQDAMVTTTTPGGQRVTICMCTRTGRHLPTFTHRPGSTLYTLATEPPRVAASAQTLLLHHRLGHPSLPRLRVMHSRLLVSGPPRSLPPLPPSPAPPYLPCVEGRQCAAPHSSSFPLTTAPLQTLHMDVWGPARVSGQSRERYFLLVVDDYTQYTTVFPFRIKGQVVDVLIPWIRTVHLQLRERFGQDLPVLCLHSDRGVMEVARTCMIHAAAPHFLWPFLVRYAAHQLNLLPRVSLPETSPTLRWTGEVGDASVFRVRGSHAFVRDTSADKLSAHAIPWVFLGFVPDAPGSCSLRCVSGRPSPRSCPCSGSCRLRPGGGEPGGAEPEGVEPGGAASEGAESGGAEPQGATSSGGSAGVSTRLSPQQLREWLVRRTRLRSGATGAGGAGGAGAGGAGVAAGAGVTGGTAATGPGGARTQGTGAGGTGGVEGAGAGDPTESRATGAGGSCTGGTGAGGAGVGGTSVGGAGAGGARAVDPGGAVRPQRQGIYYFQTFSPTPKMTTLRVLLYVAAQRDYELHSLDFSTAFLQDSLHEEIWLRRPPGFTKSFPAGTQWSLRQPFYDLRQAPREWHDTMRTTLAALGLAPATAYPSLFLCTNTSLSYFYVLVFATADTEAVNLVKSELQKRHTCTDLGELRSYLDLQITQDRARRTITLTQSHMVHQVLQRFGFQFSLPQPTPLSTSHSLSAPPSDESVEPTGPYPELVGCLMYVMTCTRPYLAYPLSILTRYVAPGRHRKVHWDAAKRVLRYLCSPSSMGLVLGGRGPVVLTGHADASWVDDSAMQRSSQGYTFSRGSGSVSWRSTRLCSVLSSSCDAEIYAGAMGAQDLRWLTYLLTDLGEQPRSPPDLYVDNKAMIVLCQEYRLEHKTKHITLRYFLPRLAYVATRANTADIFTKALPPGDHQSFSTMLGLVPTLPHLLIA